MSIFTIESDKINLVQNKITNLIKQELDFLIIDDDIIEKKCQKFLLRLVEKYTGEPNPKKINVNEKFTEYYNWNREKADLLLPYIDVNYNDYTFLNQCVRDNDSDMLGKLLELGADWRSSKILEWIMYNGQIENLKILIKYGADPKSIRSDSSALTNHPATIRFLKENY
ncbi:ankyrin repeat protein [Megavirus baoshan]|uniref:Ankyrin repeat protein n=1 Tax=Megavirus baoshan TaxID=2496520 RepID=A0A3S8UYF7_9VIRU|nr:ankyrin repeat protein [Megavirus baoshan]AZL89822.1 ankyrin repeat protein [Megavirus baoshan]